MAASLCVRLPPPLVVLLVVCLASAQPARAQRVVISQNGPGLAPGTQLLDLQSGLTATLTDDLTDRAMFSADGTVLLRRVSGEQRWRARFLATGLDLPIPDGFGWSSRYGFGSSFIPHPRDLAFYTRFIDDQGAVRAARLDASGLHTWNPCAPARSTADMDIAPDGETLFVLCEGTFAEPTADIAVLDAHSGQVVRRLPAESQLGRVHSIAAGSGGIEVLYVRLGVRGDDELVRADALTGIVMQAVPLGPFGETRYLASNHRWRRQPVLVRCLQTTTPGGYASVDCRSESIDEATLERRATLQPGGAPPLTGFSSDGRQAITSNPNVVARWDMATGVALNYVPAPANGWIAVTWGAEPQAPVLAPPVVTGHSVSLTWALPAESTAVTGYRLEAGSHPGLANILTSSLGPGGSFGAAGVPPGRYYVRVRAVNANGVRAPSNEIVIDVP